jgi:uncharacterized OB-fold protein
VGFENFGTVSFTAQAKAAEFVKELEGGRVMATRCKKCGTTYFPPRVDCPKCMSSEVEWVEIKGTGKLNSYTKVNYGPSGFENDAPYTLALGQFNGVQILARLAKDIPEKEYKVGMSIMVKPLKLANNRIAYEFQKAK